MVERPRLSRSELEVARIVWEREPATVRDVHEVLAERREIDFTTVQTFLSRLEQKGYLRSSLQGRLKRYRSRVKPAQVVGEVVGELIDTAFGGGSMPLFRHLIEERGISLQELAELRKLLDEAERHDETELRDAPGGQP